MGFLENLFAPFNGYYATNAKKQSRPTVSNEREQQEKFVKSVFDPWQKLYGTPIKTPTFSDIDREYKAEEDPGWFDVHGELRADEKEEFVQWWYDTVLKPHSRDIREEYEGQLDWKDFREKYGA